MFGAMDGLNGGADSSTGSSSFHRLVASVQQRFRYYLDKSTPHVYGRWAALGVLVLIYGLRTWYLKGFYIVTYALGIFNLNLLLGFLSPQVDPEMEGPTLPSKREDEFRPFVRRLPEFKFWYGPLQQNGLEDQAEV